MVDLLFFFSSRRRHTRYIGDWSSDVCSSELAIEPGDEKHLDGAPTIPVALLKVRSDTSHARAEALNIHCGIRGVAHRGDAHLVFRRGGATGGADFSVRPRLRGDPSEGVGAIGARRA